MKKVILSSIFSLAFLLFANVSFGQSRVEEIARQAVKDAGCVGDYTGPLTTSESAIGTCEDKEGNILELHEVLVYHFVNPTDRPYVRQAPFARVVICGTQVQTVECLY